MNERLDDLLNGEWLTPPEDFVQQIMERVEGLPMPHKPLPAPTRLEWAAVIGGSLAGLAQLVAYIFGIWTAVVAV